MRGVTLVELMVALTILIILVKVAVPAFTSMMQSTNITSAVNTFMADMRYARSEAARRGSNVVMCRSDAPEAATPACGSGSGPGSNGWVSGWLVFVDRDGSRTFNTGDQLLRAQAPMPGAVSITEGGGSSSTRFDFTALGRMRSVATATQLQFGSGNIPNERQRVVCVDSTGRARVAGDGYASC